MGENTLLLNSVLDSITFFKPLGVKSSFKTGGNAYAYCEPNSLKNLCECIEYCKIKKFMLKYLKKILFYFLRGNYEDSNYFWRFVGHG